MKKSTALVVLAIGLLVVLLDSALKYLAITRLPASGGRLGYIFGLALHKNPGIAFDIPLPLWLVISATAVIVILLGRYTWLSWRAHPERAAAAGLIMIGALGNMIDRLINGFTTDYLIFFRLSAINLSDILIFLGTILILYYTGYRSKNQARSKN